MWRSRSPRSEHPAPAPESPTEPSALMQALQKRKHKRELQTSDRVLMGCHPFLGTPPFARASSNVAFTIALEVSTHHLKCRCAGTSPLYAHWSRSP